MIFALPYSSDMDAIVSFNPLAMGEGYRDNDLIVCHNVLRKIVLNLLRNTSADKKTSIKGKMLRPSLNTDFLIWIANKFALARVPGAIEPCARWWYDGRERGAAASGQGRSR